MTDYEKYGDYQPSERASLGLALGWLLVGLGAGAIAALLMAPQSGEETRRQLRRKYEDTLDDLGEQAEEWKDRGSEWVEKAREAAESVGLGEIAGKVRPMTRKISRGKRR